MSSVETVSTPKPTYAIVFDMPSEDVTVTIN